MLNVVIRLCACVIALSFLAARSYADDSEEVKEAKKRLAGLVVGTKTESVVGFDELKQKNPKKNWEAEAKLLKHLPPVVAFQSYDSGTTNAAFKDIGGLSEMRELRLINIPITDAAFKDIGRLTKLKLVVIKDIPLTDAGLAELRTLANLETVELTGTKVTGSGFDALKGLSKLKKVRLEGPNGTDAALKPIAALPALYELALTNSKVTDQGLKNLAGCKKMGRLFLDGTQISDQALKLFQNVDDFGRLGWVTAKKTKVTKEAIDELRKVRGNKHYIDVEK